ncbi:MAG: hydroxymethylbilane synthase [Pirellulaceae bacterium]
MSHTTGIRLGTRGSALARWQADWVAEQLRSQGIEVAMVLITTQGDVRSGPIGAIGSQGVFTKEIQRALLDERVDLAVHSLKDLPTEPVEGLVLAAVPPRERPGDALVTNGVSDFASLATGARVGTGSMRRRAQLLHMRPDLQMTDIRGNVDTRLRLLDAGEFAAIVLAEAGLTRLGLAHRITQVLPKEWMLPAVGQGALGLETRTADQRTRDIVGLLDDAETHAAVLAERAVLATLRGGCLAPVGTWGRVVEGTLLLDGVVLDPLGTRRLVAQAAGPPQAAVTIGQQVAAQLLDQGAAELIAQAHALR